MKDHVITIVLASVFFSCFVIAFFAFMFFYFKKFYKLQAEKKQMLLLFQNELAVAQLEIQENTFTSISQEIHDNVGQILSLVKVQLNIMDEGETPDKTILSDAKENISKAMTDLRDIAKGLSSERIRVVGLVAAVDYEAQRINRTKAMHLNVRTEGEERDINPQKQLILFRVIQECLQNIIKHAAANSVSIYFYYSQLHFEIEISDNGKGFNFNKEQLQYTGLGLQNIFKRLQLIGGIVAIDSLPQKGTTTKLTVPYV